MKPWSSIGMLFFLAGLALGGCRAGRPNAAPAAPRVEDLSSGPVELTLIADPPQVHLDRDILLTLRISAPTALVVRLPPLDNRLQGFTLNGAFDREPETRNDKLVQEHCYRLTPALADEYRLAPLAVTCTDISRKPPVETWFATRPLVFTVAPLVSGKPGSTPAPLQGPVWIYPSAQTVLFWIVMALLGLGLVYGLWRLSRRIHRAIRLRRMSPRERALAELDELVARHLIDQNQVKEFYLALTMIIRRYIERAHAIRAPEQTTEEFLAAVARDPRFRTDVVQKLKAFLQAADLVKFAAFRPDPPAVTQALTTARAYVETDEQAQSGKANETAD